MRKTRLLSVASLSSLALLLACGDDSGDGDTAGDETGGEACVAEVPEDAMRQPGPQDDGSFVDVSGRRTTPAGPNTGVVGFPTDVAVHPLGNVVYVASTSRDDRRLVVLDMETNAVVQDIDRGDAFYGLETSPDGAQIYASGGVSGLIEVYDADVDGLLEKSGELSVGGYPSGLAVSDDGASIYVGRYVGSDVVEVDAATLTEVRTLSVPLDSVWDVVKVPGRDELYVSDIKGEGISVVDLTTGETATTLDLPTSPAGMVAAPDGSRVWAAISGADTVVAIDTASREVVAEAFVAETDFVDDAGDPLPNSNVNALWYDGASGRLYATRGADNAVSVLDGDTLELLGAIPTAWYPTDVVLSPDGDTLIISEGKGQGAGPNAESGSVKSLLAGSVTFVDLPNLDLPAQTEQVLANTRTGPDLFPFEGCEGDERPFPIPLSPDQQSPIEHVILIVKENKTFDCVLSDLEGMDIAADPSLIRYGEEATPNIHKVAREFSFSDNFYSDVPDSDAGHLFLTATHLTEYVERISIERDNNGNFEGYQVTEEGTPDAGNFFTHLVDNDVPIRVYGEIVGMLAVSKEGPIFQFNDGGYPGGGYYNTDVKDEEKARFVAGKIENGTLEPFTYLLFPNDHTEGTKPGVPTPESMVADNDYAVGIVLDALSHSEFWETSAVIILQDDPQGCSDSVDAHRSLLFVVSPYARRGYVSHAHGSYPAVFSTIERILGVPFLGRPDAAAAPLWDMFTNVPDFTPYEVEERRIPEAFNDRSFPGAELSAEIDFSGPDRDPRTDVILDAYFDWKAGRIDRAEAQRRIDHPTEHPGWEELVEESEEEREAFDEAREAYEAFKAGRDSSN